LLITLAFELPECSGVWSSSKEMLRKAIVANVYADLRARLHALVNLADRNNRKNFSLQTGSVVPLGN
jgi:hypothetical protein